MGWFQCPYKYFLYFLFLMLCLEYINSDGNPCPRYCSCYMWEGNVRRADCVNKNLVTANIDVPKRVQALDLSQNYISELKSHQFKDQELLGLQYLYISWNRISSVDIHTFSALQYLLVVDLSHNHLHHIRPQTFLHTPVLDSVILSFNKFGEVPSGPFLDVPSLKELDIGHCQLGMVQNELFLRLPSLRRLYMAENQLARVDAAVFRPLKMLEELDLSDNPLSCDGITEELQRWILEQELVDTTECQKPEEKSAKIINAVNDTKETEYVYEDLSDYWLESSEESDGVEVDNPGKSHNATTNETTLNRYFSHPFKYFGQLKIFQEIPSFWAMVAGFQVGVGLTLIATYAWLCRRSQPKTQVRRPSFGSSDHLWHELRTDVPECPETPPPPYQSCSTLPS